MTSVIDLSVIIPAYNAAKHVKKCIKILSKQNFIGEIEVIFVNDSSTDNTLKLLKKYKQKKMFVLNTKKNFGPANARNIGIKKARGKYIFFLDIDDAINKDALNTLFNYTDNGKIDIVFSDRKWIENNKNIRSNKFLYKKNLFFNEKKIKKIMEKRFFNPLDNVGFYNLTGKMIKHEIIKKNKLFFEKKLRYLEDEAFSWDLLGYSRNAIYIKKQLYSYYINPKINTALSSNLNYNYPLSNFKLVKNHIIKSLKNKRFNIKSVNEISSQGFIYLVISSIISYSRSILLGKINYNIGKLRLNHFLKKIIKDYDIAKEIKKYNVSKKESLLIVKAIKSKDLKFLEYACTERAKEIIRIRRLKKY